jgi:hypothetical protein
MNLSNVSTETLIDLIKRSTDRELKDMTQEQITSVRQEVAKRNDFNLGLAYADMVSRRMQMLDAATRATGLLEDFFDFDTSEFFDDPIVSTPRPAYESVLQGSSITWKLAVFQHNQENS